MSGPFYQPGNYVCRVKQQGSGESKAGNQMIIFEVEPTSKITQDSTGTDVLEACEQSYGRAIRLTLANDDQKEYALLKLRYAGFTGDSFSKLNLVDTDVRCVCDHKPGTGEHSDKTFENWDLMLPPRTGVALQPLDNAATRKLDALFGRKLKDGATKQPVAAVASEPASQGSTEDVPW
jgi:hypothetical protein